MVRRTFDGGTLHSERDSDTADTPVGTPLMTFTLIDGDTDDDQALESEVLAAFGSTRSASSPGATGRTATDAGSNSSVSALRRILGNDPDAPMRTLDTNLTSMGTSRLIDPQVEAPGLDESGSMLRPHPAVDRLENEFTVVPPSATPSYSTSRGLLRRRR
jgi:hypothetical protein